MSPRPCAREAAIIAAVRKSEWDDELRAHAAVCPTCAEAVLVGEILVEEAGRAVMESPLPDPARIWLDAKVRARRLQVARATRPITLVRCVAAAVGVALAAIGLAWLEPHLGRWLTWLRPPAADVFSGLAFLHGIVLMIASCAFVVFAAYALFSTRRHG